MFFVGVIVSGCVAITICSAKVKLALCIPRRGHQNQSLFSEILTVRVGLCTVHELYLQARDRMRSTYCTIEGYSCTTRSTHYHAGVFTLPGVFTIQLRVLTIQEYSPSRSTHTPSRSTHHPGVLTIQEYPCTIQEYSPSRSTYLPELLLTRAIANPGTLTNRTSCTG